MLNQYLQDTFNNLTSISIKQKSEQVSLQNILAKVKIVNHNIESTYQKFIPNKIFCSSNFLLFPRFPYD